MKFFKAMASTFAIAMLTIGISSCFGKANGAVKVPEADFEKQVSQGTVILDFFATWCPPCKKFAPVFEKAANKHPNILFVKIDVDKHKNLTEKYGVRSMPTIIALKDGKEVKKTTGFMSNKKFENWINSIS